MLYKSILTKIIAVLFISILAGCNKPALPPSQPGASTNTSTPKEIIELRPESSGEFWQKKIMGGPNGNLLVEQQTGRRDGILERKLFRENGTTKEVIEEVADTKQLKNHTTFDADGNTPDERETYYSDGKLESTSKRTADGKREELTYRQEDGKTLLQRKVLPVGSNPTTYTYPYYYGANNYESLEVFRKNGKLSHSEKILPNGDREICNYYPDGSLYARKTMAFQGTAYGYYGYNGTKAVVETFAKDGKPLIKADINSYGTHTATYYNSAGKIAYKRSFTWDGMDVTVYDENEKPLYRQIWRRAYGVVYPYVERLTDIEWLQGDNKLSKKQSFDNTGKLTKVTTYSKDGYSRVSKKSFRADGTLENEQFYDEVSGQPAKEEKHEASENITEIVAPETLRNEPYEKLDAYRLPEISGE